MNYTLAYSGKSGVERGGPYRSMVRLAPNLRRERVWFDGTFRDPLRFREAMSALHDVVVGDLRRPKKDRTAHNNYKARLQQERSQLHAELEAAARSEVAKQAPKAMPKDLEADFRRWHARYWGLRRQWARELWQSDPELWRHLVPCDPVVTVAPDSVFFECFAKDESSYGCLYVDREAFDGGQDAGLGTTNVDYSLGLYEHFQTLRTYRETKLHVDPDGFEVATEGGAGIREEKIDLPPSWLRGFGQISAATALPHRTVHLPVEALYSVLAHLRRNREKKGPRAIRFELRPERPPKLVLEPWDVEVPCHGRAYAGERAETIKVWGRRRLFALARLLPIADSIEVSLLGSGMPSLWVVRSGPLRFVLALSGWTANDWTSGGGQLALLSGTSQPDPETVRSATVELRRERSLSVDELCRATGADSARVRAAMHRICEQGQAVFDFGAGLYRYRQVVDVALGEAQLGPEPVELTKGRQLFVRDVTTIESDEPSGTGKRVVTGRVEGQACEAIFDADGVQTGGLCRCSHFIRFALKRGPCRHLIALRVTADALSKDSAHFGGQLFGSASPKTPKRK